MKNQPKNASTSFLTLILLPLILGMIFYAVLISLINGEVIQNEIAIRYLTGHPVSLFTTAMFCIGIAALLLTGKSVIDQNWLRKKITLGNVGDNDDDGQVFESESELAQACQDHLLLMPKRFREFYLWNRLLAGLEWIRRNESTENIDDELKYLSETDLDRQPERFSLVRILIWATPMLGFLGTVIGISQALGSINVGVDNDFQQMLGGLRESLYVAFDTTALALTFSILLMFGQFVIDRFDSQLLAGVDGQCRHELDRHFDLAIRKRDPETRLLEKIGDEIVGSLENASNSQIEIWSESMTQAQEQWRESAKELNRQWNDTHQQITEDHHWTKMQEQWEQIQHQWSEVHSELLGRWNDLQQERQQSWTESGDLIQQKLIDTLEQACGQIQTGICAQIETVDQQMEHRWQQLQVSMSDSSRLVHDQQTEMRLQAEAMSEAMAIVEKVIATAKDELNRSDDQLSVAISKLVETLSHQHEVQEETTRINQESQQDRLTEMIGHLGQVVEGIRQNEQQTNNQELKLRIIRPAA